MPSISLREMLQRGIAFIESGQLDRAHQLFQQLLAHYPDQPDALNLMGVALLLQKENQQAAEALSRATELRPNVAEYHSNFAAALNEISQWPKAERAARRAVELSPRLAKAWGFLAAALARQGRFEEAIDAYNRLLAMNPGDADAHSRLGVCHYDVGNYEQAMAQQQQALRLRPNFPVARLNLALMLLLLGREEEGWEQYEARHQCEGLPQHNFHQPLWDGRPLNSQRILIYTEQGLGDAIQFVRFVPEVAARGGKVLLLCQRPLKQLFCGVPGVHAILDRDEPLPEFNKYAPLLSLPRILGIRMSNMQAKVPYLWANALQIERWRERLAQDGSGKRIGLVWAGSNTHRKDAHRSIPLSMFAPLAQLSGQKFYSLQKGPRADELRSPPPGLELTDYASELETMADTAALIENLDLIITVDTSVCHLAGALGKPVWTLIAAVPHWGWGLKGESTAWYPTMRLFRQSQRGQWEDAIKRVTQALRNE